MPLVRIIARLAEYPTELVRDLRARGFDVETCISRDEQQTAAGLEITIDQCSPENISQSVADAMTTKDVVILANAQAQGRSIRSIGMVLLSSENSMQTDRKTVVPAQLNEIYTALLRGRLDRKTPATFVFANLGALCQKTILVSRQWSNSTWRYCHAVGKNLGQFSAQTVSEAAIWVESRKLNWRFQTHAHKTSRIEPDLVPSMFNLSGVESYSTEPPVENPELEVSQSTHTSNTVRPFRLWKPVAVASAAVLAIALLFHGFSHSTLKANQISQENNKGSVQPQVLIPAAQVIRKIGKADSETASKVLAKSRNDDDTFQEVVVRHFTQPSPRTALPNGGNKRRVVVD